MAARVSPAATLLRKSRLFSLPPHIPPPARPLSAEPLAYSETATKLYPTHQAIITPPSSAARGDWGLKRPLPAKSTIERSSSPVVRVNRLDTLEHITDFDSAADHVRTVQKFHELELPLSKPPDRTRGMMAAKPTHQSVFEEDAIVAAQLRAAFLPPAPLTEEVAAEADAAKDGAAAQDDAAAKEDTAAKEDAAAKADAAAKDDALHTPPARYRYKGPWLAGQSEAEFTAYLSTISRRKPAFLRFLRHRFHAAQQSKPRQAQLDGSGITAAPQPVAFSERAFQHWLRAARHNPEHHLAPALRAFLDFAPPRVGGAADAGRRSPWTTGPANIASPEYAMTGPPKVHPSAGLSYLRTGARLFNHPAYGPQRQRPAAEARILKSARAGSSTARGAAGVGGFIAANSDIRFTDAALQSPDVPGGLRVKAHATRAMVGAEGAVLLDVATVSQVQEYLGNPRVYGQGRGRYVPNLPSMRPTASRVTRPMGESNERYAYYALKRMS